MRVVCCSVCGAHQQKPFLVETTFVVVACTECGHLYTSPLPETEAIAARYAASGNWIKSTNTAKRTGSDSRFYRYAKELECVIPKGGTILEIGCSKGYLLNLLQQRGFDCYGIEPSRDAEVASQLLGAQRVTHGTYTQPLPFLANAVTMFEVLEHIPEPHEIASIVYQQLHPGGYFMGSVPNGTFIRAKVWPKRVLGLKSLGVPLIMDAGNHINYFSPYGIQIMLERIGFNFIWVKNAPLDFNYTANRLSPMLKRAWWIVAQSGAKLTGSLVASNIWFLAQRPR